MHSVRRLRMRGTCSGRIYGHGLANNHALDFGPEGQQSTRAALDRVGIALRWRGWRYRPVERARKATGADRVGTGFKRLPSA